MKKREMLNRFSLEKIGPDTVFVQNQFFCFCYHKADAIVKEEYKGQYRYFGGLQSEFEEGSEDYKNLENWLIEIAEQILSI